MAIMRWWITYIVLFCTLLVSAQSRSRIEGLMSNSEYVELIKQDSVMSVAEKTLSEELAANRKIYDADSADAASVRQKIADIEQSLIDISVQKSAVNSKINTIEQVWSIDQIANKNVLDTIADIASKSEDAVRIVQSRYARETLSSMDYKNFISAESSDKRVAAMVGDYVSNYDTLALLSVEYDAALTKAAADSIVVRYNYIDSLNRIVANDISRVWSEVVDNKSFAYAMLIEKSGSASLFAKDESLKIKSAKLVDSLRSQTISEELLNYYASRLSMVELEYSLALDLKLPHAVDSLRVVRDSLRIVEFNYPKVNIATRLFIDYEPIKFSSKAVYSGSNPIPDGKIYESGVIYRLLVGSFKSRQAATLFRGAYPIYIIKNDAGLLSYYLGGYETKAEAQIAKEMLLKRGFRRPEVVEWRDGVAPNHSSKAATSGVKYRVEIDGLSELTAQHRSTIETQGAGRELSKVGATNFVVGLFDTLKSAEHLVESLKIVDAKLSISIGEVK
ncbi:MAG: hypothetical protein SNI57_07285 [Rikenellaceae bacterium]